jgi:hypothetical protein
MRPTPIQPKRADFASFDDYFDAMIQYHLELSPIDSEDPQIQDPFATPQASQQHQPELSSASVSLNGEIKLPEAKNAWRQRLQKFVQAHQQ